MSARGGEGAARRLLGTNEDADIGGRTSSYLDAVSTTPASAASTLRGQTTSPVSGKTTANGTPAATTSQQQQHADKSTATKAFDLKQESSGTKQKATQPEFADPKLSGPQSLPNPVDRPLTTPGRWLSYIFFSYFNPICRIGSKRQLNNEDLFAVPSQEVARTLTDRLEKEWHKELAKGERGWLVRAYVRTFWRIWCFTSLLYLIELVLQVMEPVMLGQVIRNLQNDGEPAEAYRWAGGLIGAVFA